MEPSIQRGDLVSFYFEVLYLIMRQGVLTTS